MKSKFRIAKAFSRLDLLITIVIVIVVIGWTLPHLARGGKSSRAACVGNLKQVAIGFLVFSGDHQGKFPMQVSTNDGGSMEFRRAEDTFRHFQAGLKQIGNNPQLLVCARDTRKRALYLSQLSNENVSYFVSLSATTNSPALILAGDRNLTRSGTPLGSGVYDLNTNASFGWDKTIHKNFGIVVLADGSIRSGKAGVLNEHIRLSGATNRISVP